MSVKDVLLKSRGKVEVEHIENENKNTNYVASINENIKSLGYTLSEKLFKELENQDVEYLAEFHNWLITELRKSVGADVYYEPMYPNFPREVMEMDEVELYMNEINHYWNRDLHHAGYDEYIDEPEYEKEDRLPLLKENINMKEIELAEDDERFEILRNLLSSSVAYSEQDRNDINEFMKEENWKKYLPEKIDNKENIAYLMAQALDSSRYLPNDYEELDENVKVIERKKADNKAINDAYSLKKYIKNATDILRVYSGMTDGNVALNGKINYRPISRKKRRFLLSLIEDTDNLWEEMSTRPEEFKKLFKMLHVCEYKDKNGNLLYPKTAEAINKIRDGQYSQTFLGKVQSAIDKNDMSTATDLLKTNPGYFARKLDELLRKDDNFASILEELKNRIEQVRQKNDSIVELENAINNVNSAEIKENMIIDAFKEIANKVDPKVLLGLREHFKQRTQEKDYRVFFPKGNVAKAYTKKNDLESISEELSERIVSICDEALIEIYKTKGDLGKVYISEDLKGIKAPLVLRNMTEGSKVITRGSRIPTDEEKDILRAFIWWKDDLDNDLSAVLLDENWSPKSHISYTDLRNKYGCHSGDITYQRDNGHEGECEFIDVDLDSARKDGIRYIAFQVHSFSNIPFSKENCKFGYMERNEAFDYSKGGEDQMYPNTGEIFEPLTVKHVMDITANSTSMMPFVYDTQTREIIWCDAEISGNFENNNVESSLSSATACAYACANSEAPSLYDVLYLNALARGEITENKEEADEIFDLEEGITPFDTDVIVSRFLGKEEDQDCKEGKERKELERLQKEREKYQRELEALRIKAQEAKIILDKYEERMNELERIINE